VERRKNQDPHGLTGTENIGPENTLEGDYGPLLERAYSAEKHAEGGTSPSGSAARWRWEGGCAVMARQLDRAALSVQTLSPAR